MKTYLTTPYALLAMGTLLLCILLVFCRSWIPNGIWRILCFFPLLLCVIHFLHFNFGIQWKYSLIYFGPLYLTALLFVLWQFIPHQNLFHRITAGILLTLSVFNVLVSGVPIRLHCYTLQSWTDNFIATVRTMEKEYALSNWKQIDYDALLEEFVPRIQQAEANHDVTQLGIILYDYTNRFYDGHVELFPGTAEIGTDISKALIGNDYGLSLISLDNGTVVAVQIEPDSEAARSGIRTGTVITHWNGVPVEQAKYSFLLPGCPPVAENEEPIRTILLAGQGGESVSITFNADDGSKKTVQLHRIGDYISRYQTVYNKFLHLTENDENYSCKMITPNCGYLRINAEELSTFEEIYTEFSGQAPFAAKRFEQILSQLQSEGMDRLIIDIRNNTGGNRTVSTALASLFTEETFHYTYGSPSRTEDAHILKGDPWVISGTGKWKDLPVVVLVNQKTVSGGDLMADLMGALPNVTLMGMTPSNGSCQSTGGVIFIAEGYFKISYPIWLNTDKNGDPIIDTDPSRVTRIPLEIEIPVTDESIQIIYGNNPQDYELDFAINWLENQQ